MDELARTQPDWRDLMASVGETLLQWGFLENNLREYSTGRGVALATITRSNAMSLWREHPIAHLSYEIEEVNSLRNLLAHGMTSATANPWGEEAPKVRCRSKDGVIQEITFDDLQKLKRRIHTLRMALGNCTASSEITEDASVTSHLTS